MYDPPVPRRRPFILLFVPVPVILLLCLVEALGLTHYVGDRFYDLFLRIERPPRVAQELLLVDIDDRAIATVGAWPWSRDLIAEGLLLMKEMEAAYAVFDTPLAGRAPLGVDRGALRDELPDALQAEYGRIAENVRSLFDAIRRGSVRPGDSPRYVAELVGLIEASRVRLIDSVAQVERDNDLYLGQALRLFEHAYVAVEMDTSRGAAVPSLVELDPMAHFSLQNVGAEGLDPLWTSGLLLPAPHVAQGARGGGFREIAPDYDGVVRRVRLLAAYRGRQVGQVAFAAVLDRLGEPEVSVTPELIILSGEISAGADARIAIPLTREGELLIDWPHPRSGSTPRRLSWNDLYRLGQLEADLVVMFREMDRAGYLTYFRSAQSILDRYRAAESLRDLILADGRTSLLDDWRNARGAYFALADALLGGDVERRIVADAERVLASPDGTEEERAGTARTRKRVPELFQEARRTREEIAKLRATLHDALSGSFCLVSVTGASATIVGSTPLGAATTSGQASAALVNAVLTRQFFLSLSRWYSVGAAGVLGFLVALTLLRARPRASFVTGIIVAALPCVAAAILLIFSRIYADPTAPAAGAFLVCSGISAIKARQERADRGDW